MEFLVFLFTIEEEKYLKKGWIFIIPKLVIGGLNDEYDRADSEICQ